MTRGKGEGSLYRRKSDGMWVGAVTLPINADGKRRRKVVARADKAEAMREMKKIRTALANQGDLDTAKPPTLNEWIDDWWKRYRPNLKVSVWDDYESKIRLYVRPSIGHVRLDLLAPRHVHHMHAYVTDELGLTSSTANGVHHVLRAVLRDALTEDRVRRNVAAVTKAPERSTTEADYLDTEDAKKLLKSLDPGNGTVTAELALRAVAYLAGLRQGERLALTRDMIDLDRKRIVVAWSLTRLTYQHGCGAESPQGWPCGRRKGGYCPKKKIEIPDNQDVLHVDGGLYMVRPKNKNAWREVPIVGLLEEVLRIYLDDYEPGPNGLVFTRINKKTGKRTAISGDMDSKGLKTALAAAEIRPIRGHSARHTCNTLLIELGTADDVRFAIIGHASARSNATYTHTSDSRKIDAIDGLGRELDWRTDHKD